MNSKDDIKQEKDFDPNNTGKDGNDKKSREEEIEKKEAPGDTPNSPCACGCY